MNVEVRLATDSDSDRLRRRARAGMVLLLVISAIAMTPVEKTPPPVKRAILKIPVAARPVTDQRPPVIVETPPNVVIAEAKPTEAPQVQVETTDTTDTTPPTATTETAPVTPDTDTAPKPNEKRLTPLEKFLIGAGAAIAVGAIANNNRHHDSPQASIEVTPNDKLVLNGNGSGTITVRNSGAAPLDLRNIRVEGNLRRETDCPPHLQPGAPCTITVSLNEFGRATSGRLIIESNASNAPSVAVPISYYSGYVSHR